MYLKYYGLREEPFGVTPDPNRLYLGPAHREALASLDYGIQARRGFMALIAPPGMGKTTLLFHLMQKYARSARTAFLFQTQCDSREFLRYLFVELGLDARGKDFVVLHDEFNQMLVREARVGKRVIVVVDEAQNLEPSVLETVRLLSDFETPRAKLMQIILAGQAELADRLASPELSQLRQRLSAVIRLQPLSAEQVAEYVAYRLRAAGHPTGHVFTTMAIRLITEQSEGVPRLINHLCFNSLSLAYGLGKKMVDAGVVQEVISDLDVATAGRGGVRSAVAAGITLEDPEAVPAEPVEAAAAGTEPSKEQPAVAPRWPGSVAEQETASAAGIAAGASAACAIAEDARMNAAHPVISLEKPKETQRAASLSLTGTEHVLGNAGRNGMPRMTATRTPSRVAMAQNAPARKGNTGPSGRAGLAFLAAAKSQFAGFRASSQRGLRSFSGQMRAKRRPRSWRRMDVALLSSSSLVLLVLLVYQFGFSAQISTPGKQAQNGVASSAKAIPQAQPAQGNTSVTAMGDAATRANVTSVVFSVHANSGEPPALVHKVDPVYPSVARDAHVQGTVVLAGAVGWRGTLRDVRVVSGEPALAQAAVQAVKQWRFEPPKGSSAVPIEITVAFELPRGTPRMQGGVRSGVPGQ